MARFNHPAVGSVAVVTGASSGLGREFARTLALRGHVVLAVARRREPIAQLAAEVATAGGPGRIEPLAQDVTAPDAPEVIHAAARRLGQLGWLVNNAGSATFGRFEQSPPDEERAQVRLNVESVVMLTRRLLPDLVQAGRGIVLNVGSSAGLQATPGWVVYGASKAFVIAFSEGLFEELRGSGVSVTALAPGPVTTAFFGDGAAAHTRKPLPWELSPADCAARAVRAALAGKPFYAPGLMVKLLAFGSRFSPRGAARRVSALIGLRFVGMPPMGKR
ncbi:MAG TPA: SDR family NAD(P)-dependent oxidoreductase [Polyangia bacterium]|nr:SDR family NAD(P)-dependent oxidoreductase [Polyangia bacterium]